MKKPAVPRMTMTASAAKSFKKPFINASAASLSASLEGFHGLNKKPIAVVPSKA
jgi:hypothetical protein